MRQKWMRAVVKFAIILGLALSFGMASPDVASANSAFGIGKSPDWFLPIGFNLGYTNLEGDGGHGFTLGGEASLVRVLPDGVELPLAVGGYADFLYDINNRQARASFGPEVALMFVGVDGGPVVKFGRGGTDLGIQGRFFLTAFSVTTLYVGGGKTFWGERDAFFQTGALFKFPIKFE